jgi:hypothetical protein
MRFDGALGNVEIASDFRVVTTLEQQVDDLPFAWPYSWGDFRSYCCHYWLELRFHKIFHNKNCTCTDATGPLLVALQAGWPARLDFELRPFAVSICNRAAKSG